MKVVCKINNLSNISDESVLDRLKKYISIPDGEIDLDVGREYTAYGVVFWDNSPWYYLCSEDYDEYPKPFASDFFDVVDDQLSPCWKLCHVARGDNEPVTSLVFDEWSKAPSFYERLIEGDPDAVNLFAKYRIIMDQE